MSSFGKYIKEKRLEKSISLKKICIDLNLDAVEWSKIERGRIHPYQSKEFLYILSNYLDLNVDQVIDLARKDKNIIFKKLSLEEITKKMPLFWHLKPEEITEELFFLMAESIKNSY